MKKLIKKYQSAKGTIEFLLLKDNLSEELRDDCIIKLNLIKQFIKDLENISNGFER